MTTLHAFVPPPQRQRLPDPYQPEQQALAAARARLTDGGAGALDWPGAVTWVLPAGWAVPAWLTGGRDTLAVRVTAHAGAAALCRAGLAMCSYGQPAPCIQTPSGLQVAEMREYGPLHAEAQALLQLGSGRLLPSLWSYKTTHKYIQDGRAAHSRLLCELQGMLLQFQSENKHTAKLL